MSDLATLGLVFQTKGAENAVRTLDQVEQKARGAEKATDGLAGGSVRANSALGQLDGAAAKAASALGMIAKAAAAAGIAIGAMQLAKFITESTVLAARYDTLSVVMRVAANNAGYLSSQAQELEGQLRKQGITAIQSRNAIIQLATANVDLKYATELGAAAQNLAVVGMINSSEAYDRLIYGIKSGQVEVLRTLGLNVSFEKSYQSLAKELKKTTAELNEREKSQARVSAVLQAAASYEGIYEESMTKAGKAAASLKRYWEDLQVSLGENFLPIAADGVFMLTDALKEAQKAVEELGRSELIQAIIVGLGGAFKAVAIIVSAVTYSVGQLLRLLGATIATAAALARLDFSAAAEIGKSFRKDWDAAAQSYGALLAKQVQGESARQAAMAMTEEARIAASAAARAEQEAQEAAAAAAEKAEDAAKKAAAEGKRRAEAAARAAQAEIDRADQMIKSMREEIEEIGKTEAAVRALKLARQIDAAPLQRQKELIALLGREREAALATAEAHKNLRDLQERNAERSMSPTQQAEREARRLMEAARAENQEVQEWTERYAEMEIVLAEAIQAASVEIKELSDAQKQIEFDTWFDQMHRLLAEYEQVRRAGDDLFYGIKNRDWAGAFSGLLRAIEQVQKAFSKTGTMADKVMAVAGVADSVGQAIGGKTGSAISSAANAGATAFAVTKSPFVAAAAAAAAGVAELLKRQPTNAGAGYDLVTDQISGNKRTTETERAAVDTAKAIRAMQMALESAGLGLSDSVRGLVIGTRDATTIYLQSGQELKSAVGDGAAAVDAAMRALVSSAKFASEGQERVAKAAMAAGGGLEEVSAALETYAAAQNISANLADEIMRLTDPKAYDLQSVSRAIEEQRKAYEALTKEGYLTAEQFATITDQLSKLEGLQLDEVIGRYTDAVNDNAEAAERAAATQATQIGLMRQLQAMDDAVLGTNVALLATRADELAKLDDVSQGLQKIIWAREDEAKVIEANAAAMEAANAKAAETLKQRTSLEDQLLTAMGRTSEVTARQRAATLEGLDPSLRGLQSALYAVTDANARVAAAETGVADARSALTEAYQRESSALKTTIDRFRGFADSLKAFRAELMTGDLAANSPSLQYSRTKADFERVASLASQGNEEALGDLQGVSEAYLKASADYQRTNIGYFRDLSAVKNATKAAEGYASQQVDQGSAQLNALNAQVSALGILNQSTLSVGQAVTNVAAAVDALARAMAAKSAADAAARQALLSAGVIPKASESIAIAANDNADVAAAKAIYLSTQGGIGMAAFNRYVGADPFATMRRVGYDGDPEALRKKYGFQTGGSFTVGGTGGPDSQIIPLHATPGEIVNVRRPGDGGGDNSELIAEIRALRAEVSSLRADTAKTAQNTAKTANTLTRVTRDGDSLITEAA